MAENRVRNQLDDAGRTAVYMFLLENTDSGKLRHGAIAEACSKFQVSRWQVSRIHTRGKAAESMTAAAVAVQSVVKNNPGRPTIKRSTYS